MVNPTDIIEARLYTCAVYSERLIKQHPGPLEEGMINDHEVAAKFVTFAATEFAVPITQNIFVLRNQIFRLARKVKTIKLIPELLTFHERSKSEGY